jgi:hypothetical protein
MPLFETSTQFSMHIEDLASKTGETFIETILEFCDENMVDYDEVAKLISPTLKQKIFDQAKVQWSMPKETTVPLDD